jgi:hypothetical protein
MNHNHTNAAEHTPGETAASTVAVQLKVACTALGELATCDADMPRLISSEALSAIEQIRVAGAARQSEDPADQPYRVALFWSSANPGKKVRMLAQGDDIAQWAKRSDFIEWVDISPAPSHTIVMDMLRKAMDRAGLEPGSLRGELAGNFFGEWTRVFPQAPGLATATASDRPTENDANSGASTGADGHMARLACTYCHSTKQANRDTCTECGHSEFKTWSEIRATFGQVKAPSAADAHPASKQTTEAS